MNGDIYKRCDHQYHTHKYQRIDTGTAGSGHLILHEFVCQGDFAQLVDGYSYRIQACKHLVTGFTGICGFVTEAEPDLRIVQLVAGGWSQLLDIVEDMVPEDDSLGDVGLEHQGAVVVSDRGGDLTALLIEQAEGTAGQCLTGVCRHLVKLHTVALGGDVDIGIDLFHRIILDAVAPKGDVCGVGIFDGAGKLFREDQSGIVIQGVHHRLGMEDHDLHHVDGIAVGILLCAGAIVGNGEIVALLQGIDVAVAILGGDDERTGDIRQGLGHLVTDV